MVDQSQAEVEHLSAVLVRALAEEEQKLERTSLAKAAADQRYVELSNEVTRLREALRVLGIPTEARTSEAEE